MASAIVPTKIVADHSAMTLCCGMCRCAPGGCVPAGRRASGSLPRSAPHDEQRPGADEGKQQRERQQEEHLLPPQPPVQHRFAGVPRVDPGLQRQPAFMGCRKAHRPVVVPIVQVVTGEATRQTDPCGLVRPALPFVAVAGPHGERAAALAARDGLEAAVQHFGGHGLP